MNISTVNELIKSLESAGELSIKERKYLELAKAFKQLAAENVELKGALTGRAYINFIKANGWNVSASTVNGKFVNFADPEVDFGSMVFAHAKKLVDDIKTPATDRIVAGIKADAIDDAAVELDRVDTVASTRVIGFKLREFSQQLREGAK
ncbi:MULTISPECIES: hypothetical protein [Klebsiella]|uniref:Uncharacterized protein n=1 Tax=Klebsiella michiganensis TaxID=1134687 RepID=A0AB35PUP9_9ENTR|nr:MULTISPECIES: hypothetical protein [Klebsiella]HCB9021994.1 hypothetical protein [Klebsiella pneumoniae]HEO9291319.1 hypothetical protein [Klebsiella pneumoniae subsp. pneumoniae]MBG2685806.1 hypothetical protein [Klebsiella michiganensis]MBL0786033.1 hypothetical protein [Klebsiella michiganensis]MBZ7420296.1 hypothetical protein [Klebsiella michiganensis]